MGKNNTMKTLEAKELRELLDNYSIHIENTFTDDLLYTQQDIIHRLIKWLDMIKILNTNILDITTIWIIKTKRDFHTNRNNSTDELAIKLNIDDDEHKLMLPKFLKNIEIQVDTDVVTSITGIQYLEIELQSIESLFTSLENYSNIIDYREANRLKILNKDSNYYTRLIEYKLEQIRMATNSLGKDNITNIETILIIIKVDLIEIHEILKQYISYLKIEDHMKASIAKLEVYIRKLYNNPKSNNQTVVGLYQQYIKILKQIKQLEKQHEN